MKKKQTLILCTSLLTCAALLTTLAFKHQEPARRSGKTELAVPNILKVGDVPGALQQSRRLYLVLKDAGWDPLKVPFKLMHFADQKFAEDPGVRDDNLARVAIPDLGSNAYKEVAFFLDIYVRKNIRHQTDVDAVASPEGFYIVCYKNGDIQQIPVEDVRLMPKSAHAQYRECFPGQALYKKSLPQLEYVALASKQKP